MLIITLAPSPIPSQIPRTLFDIISLGVDAVLSISLCKKVIQADKELHTDIGTDLCNSLNGHIPIIGGRSGAIQT